MERRHFSVIDSQIWQSSAFFDFTDEWHVGELWEVMVGLLAGWVSLVFVFQTAAAPSSVLTYRSISPIAHANITASFFKLDTHPMLWQRNVEEVSYVLFCTERYVGIVIGVFLTAIGLQISKEGWTNETSKFSETTNRTREEYSIFVVNEASIFLWLFCFAFANKLLTRNINSSSSSSFGFSHQGSPQRIFLLQFSRNINIIANSQIGPRVNISCARNAYELRSKHK